MKITSQKKMNAGDILKKGLDWNLTVGFSKFYENWKSSLKIKADQILMPDEIE